MPFTYILHSASLDRFYVGHTDGDLQDRLRRHLSDHKGFTGKAKDWQIVWFSEFPNKAEAYAEERRIKARKSRAFLLELMKPLDP